MNAITKQIIIERLLPVRISCVVLIVISVINLQGCFYLSSRVSEIGAMRHRVVGDVPVSTGIADVTVKVYSLESTPASPYTYIPYRNLEIFGDPSYSYIGKVDFTEFLSRNINNAEVICIPFSINIDGEIKIFDRDPKLIINKEKSNLLIVGTRDDRKWYGYPAQALVLVAAPLDLTIDAIWWICHAVVYPFVL